MIDKNSILLETKKKLFSVLTGEHTSIFNGNGLEFKALRQYTTDDDIRHINWKKTSKSVQPSVNTFNESRQLNVVLVYLNSGSLYFGSCKSKKATMAEVFTSLSKVSILHGDLVTSVFFSNNEEKFYKPTKDKNIIDINLHTIATQDTLGKEVNYNKLTYYLLEKIKKKSLIFLIGDFLDFDTASSLHKVAYKHELYCGIIRDHMEEDLSLLGEFDLLNTNNNHVSAISLNTHSIRKYNENMENYDAMLLKYFNSSNIKFEKIYTSDNSVDGVKRLVTH